MLVRQLPLNSKTAAAMDPERARWGLAEQLLAVIANATRDANWQRSAKSDSAPRPPYIGPKFRDPDRPPRLTGKELDRRLLTLKDGRR